MRKQALTLLGLVLAMALVSGCGPATGSVLDQLTFEAQMNVDSGQRFHTSLGVRNVSQTRFRDYQALNARMELANEAGEKLGSISVATLWELGPGNAGWPAAYASKLPAGAYQLTWGAPGADSIVVDFTIVELDGWLYLGERATRNAEGEELVDEREYGAVQSLVDLARVNLAQKLGVGVDAVTVESVDETDFPDASLGVPEPDEAYAQVLTPGYAIRLMAGGQAYEYRASNRRLAFVPPESQVPHGEITIEGVQVADGDRIVVRGRSTLAAGTCLGSELWANGELQGWWPGDRCVEVQDGAWQMVVALGSGEVPPDLDPSAQYMLRVYQQNGPDIVSVFAFDLAGPPTPVP
jgi:hypothetical protein